MDANSAFFYAFFCGICAFLLSLFMELFLKPRPGYKRPFFAWLCHFGLFLSLYALFLLLLNRPLCSAAALLAIYLIFILVNNAKYESLREPFLYQDYDYFLDVIRFPRLYLPFLGLRNFIFCVLGCLLAIAGILLENPPSPRFGPHGLFIISLLILAIGLLSLFIGSLAHNEPTYHSLQDYKKLGFPSFLYLYGLENQKKINKTPPFPTLSLPLKNLPHLIAIQSESFFDPRVLDPNLSAQLLANLDKLRQQSFLHGFLDVPAWGANTVRTEFSFLTGIDPERLGPHQFNPYRAMLSGWIPDSLPSQLKALGYETICLHPWHAAFYGRKRLFPKMGFDKFLDIKAFSDCPRSGAYTDDRCLADKALSLLNSAQKPLFFFIITMENHGPIEEEKENQIDSSPYRNSCRADCPELPVYMDHLHHADLMLARLHQELAHFPRPVSLCFYGDHVPIMPRSYEILGYPKGDTPYFCWSNYRDANTPSLNMQVYKLAHAWLKGSMPD